MSRGRALLQEQIPLTDFEKHLINHYQGGFPLTAEPFKAVAEMLEVSSEQVQRTVKDLLERGVLTRFGPLYNIEKADGVFSLCALKVPEDRFDAVAEQVNEFAEVAHNYQRDHEWNMWFVLATRSESELVARFEEITRITGCPGLNLPKEKEFFVGLRFEA